MSYLRTICALLALVPLWGQQPGFTISGTVVQKDTNQPLRHVLVVLARTQPREGEQPLSIVTEANGGFRFDGLTAGKYVLSAQRGMAPARTFLQHGSYSTAIVTGPGLDTEHIRFPLESLGSLSRTVVDEENEAVRQGSIFLFRKGIVDGRYRTVFAGRTSLDSSGLDSSGEFYFGHLEPGTYFVAVQAHPWYALTPEPHAIWILPIR